MIGRLGRLFGRRATSDVASAPPTESEEAKRLEALARASREKREHSLTVLNSEIDGVKIACRALVKQVRSDLSQLDKAGGRNG